MKKVFLFAAIAALILSVAVPTTATAEERPTYGCDSGGCWMERELPKEKSDMTFKIDQAIGIGAGGGYLRFVEKKDGYGIGTVDVSYRLLDRQLKLGFEIGGEAGVAGANEAAVLVDGSMVWYPAKYFGLSIGYAYFRACAIGKDDPSAAHLAELDLRVPITSWLELQFYGQIGWGWWVKPTTKDYEVRDLVWPITTDIRSRGMVAGGGANLKFYFINF